MINLQRVMRSTMLGARRIIRRRPRATTFGSTGRADVTYEDTPVIAIVQPATRDAAKFLEEGTRLENVRVFWSESELSMGDGKNFDPDVLVDRGASYRVIYAEPRPDGGYFRVWAEGFVT